MPNRVIYPAINPLQFYKQVPDTDSRYNSRLFDNWYFSDTILPWEQQVDWHQPWQRSDNLHLQLHSNYGPINLKLYTEAGALVDTIQFSQIMVNFNDPEMYIYEVDVDMSGYDEGCYYFTITFGNPVALTFQSEKIILSDSLESTLLLEYSHPSFREDMIFETDIQPKMRIPAILKFKGPASKNTVYEDQPLNLTVIRSLNYRVFTLDIGAGKGVPDYMADKIDRILGCRTLLIDGVAYTKIDGSIEPAAVEDYPLRGWRIDVRPSVNRASAHYENEEPQGRTVAVMINVDSKGFGTDTGGSETVITDVE